MAGQSRRVKVKLEGSPLGRSKQGYSAPIYAEAPDLFPLSIGRSYTRNEFHDKYGLSCGGINPKHLKPPDDFMDEDLCQYLGPVVNKNEHRYMFLRNEEAVKKLELLWMQIHQKHCLLSSRLISLGMARGFYCQEKLNVKLNWAAYVEWTNNEQLRRRQKSMKQGRVADDSFFLDDEDVNLDGEDGGSSGGSKTLSGLDSPSRQESFSGTRLQYEGFGGPGVVIAAIDAWKSYGGIMSEEHGKMVKSLTLEKKAKDDFTLADARAKGQMEFCLEKLSDALEKLHSLEELKTNELVRIFESGLGPKSGSILLDTLSHDIEGQKKVVACCESWASDGQSSYLKVQETEFGVAARVTCLEGRILQLNRHEVAVKSCISRLESGATLFKSVPPQPIYNLSVSNQKEWIELGSCVFCGLGFEPVWAVVLGTCKCAYHHVCCRVHFQESTMCIEGTCKKEMHGDWWIAHGIVKPGTKAFHAAGVKNRRPSTIHEVQESPIIIHLPQDEVEEVLLTQKSTEVPAGWTSSIPDLPNSPRGGGSSNLSPFRTPKSTRVGDQASCKGPSLCEGEPAQDSFAALSIAGLDKSEGSPLSVERESILEGPHMKSKGQRKSPGSSRLACPSRRELEAPILSDGPESEQEHDEDSTDFEDQHADEEADSDDEEGEEHAEDSATEEATVDESVKKKTKKRGKGGTKRKSISNLKAVVVENSKQKKVPVEARKSTASNTRAAAKVAK